MFLIEGASEYFIKISFTISLAKGIPPVFDAPAPKKKIGLGCSFAFDCLIIYAISSIVAVFIIFSLFRYLI